MNETGADPTAAVEGSAAESGVLEQALLPVTPGHEAEFEAAFDKARLIIAGMPGFRELTLARGIESPSTYLLLVRWDTVEDHEIGFRSSSEYQEWRGLLHHFYAEVPTVEHFAAIEHLRP